MRLPTGIGVEAAVTRLPPTTADLDRAVDRGLLTDADRRSSGYHRLPVATEAAPDLAVRAATDALAAAGRDPAEVGLLAHASIYHQGHDFWSAPHYVADRIGAHRAVPVGVQQMCNGGAAALEVAVTRLIADPATRVALVTTADRFAGPGFDRWRGDYGVLYGDGATAAVLGRSPGRLLLRGLHTVAAADLESMHRGDDAFTAAPRAHGDVVDVRRTKKAFLATAGRERFTARVAGAVREVLAGVLAECEVAADDPRLRLVLAPRLGADAYTRIYRPAVAAACAAPLTDLGAETGHLGAGDALANLAALTGPRHALGPGDLAVILSAGAGFTWTALLVEQPSEGVR